MKEIDQTAKVKAVKTIEIKSDIESVWNLLTDIDNWPNWNPEISKAYLQGTLKVGQDFKWKTGGTQLHSKIHSVEPFKSFGWTGKVYGVYAVHNWKLNKKDKFTIVICEESMNGFLTNIFPKMMQKSLENAMNKWLNVMKNTLEV